MFTIGFSKVAIDFAGLRKASRRVFSNSGVRREAGVVSGGMFGKMVPEGADALKKSKSTIGPSFNPSTGKIHQAKDVMNTLRSSGIDVSKHKLESKDREALNRLGTLHEQSEKKFTLKKMHGKEDINSRRMFAGHAHPGVIIEESNALASMGKQGDRLRAVHKDMRSIDKTKDVLESKFPGFKYGETRVSRHAKKRMAAIIGKHNARSDYKSMMARNKALRESAGMPPMSLSEWKDHYKSLKRFA